MVCSVELRKCMLWRVHCSELGRILDSNLLLLVSSFGELEPFATARTQFPVLEKKKNASFLMMNLVKNSKK